METKICIECGKEKDLSEFIFRNREKGTYNGRCKSCLVGYRKKFYDTIKDSARSRKNKMLKIEWFREYKKNLKCEMCGESHPAIIDFHHINQDTKKDDITRLVNKSLSIENIKKEISLCQVLCSNCHRKLHWVERK